MFQPHLNVLPVPSLHFHQSESYCLRHCYGATTEEEHFSLVAKVEVPFLMWVARLLVSESVVGSSSSLLLPPVYLVWSRDAVLWSWLGSGLAGIFQKDWEQLPILDMYDG